MRIQKKLLSTFSLSEIENGNQMTMTDNLENWPETIPQSCMISRWVSMIFTRYQDMVTTVFCFLQGIQANS